MNIRKLQQNYYEMIKKYRTLKDPHHSRAGNDQQVNRYSKSKSWLLWSSMTAIMVLALTACGLLVAELPAAGEAAGSSPALVCYYATSAAAATHALRPADIHPHLCTHINVAFARVHNKQVQLTPDQLQSLAEVVKLKSINPDLKILLSIGGAGESDEFSDMIVSHASRKTFIRSIKAILRNYTLDGIDLDWEFPAVHNKVQYKGKRERQHFSQLLHEIRNEYIREKRPYLLSVAVAAPETIVDVAYDVDQLNQYVDFINVMTYDFHFFNKFTPFTGLNSPLFARASEQLFMASLNINYTVNMYVNKGMNRDKIVVGIPTYGHTFTLVNPDNTAIGSPASGYGSLGSKGFVDYPDICAFMQNFTRDVVVKFDEDARVPYLYKDNEWVSYDTPQSVMEKTKFIKENNLYGAMIYSLNADDYRGVCKGEAGVDIKFPLAQAARRSLLYPNGS